MENNVFSRTYDQDQWARAFGPTSLFPRVDGGIGTPIGPASGTSAPSAGRRRRPADRAQPAGVVRWAPGRRARPDRRTLPRRALHGTDPGRIAIAPQISFGNRGFFPNTDYVALDDMTEIS
ncbi:MAG: hypothetical protein IPH81_20340 [Candidatus Microthrix sp.]|nr:hypothetical protein [Candidatus Microthrix sp.]